MIYDCFTFNNELDILEIRLNILNSTIDKFVLVEATRTHQNKKKPLYFENNKDRYKNFNDKIIHIIVDQYPSFWTNFKKITSWDLENHQRNQIAQGLTNCNVNDIIIISDVDEIPNPQSILSNKNTSGIKVFEQYFFQYFLNCLLIKNNNGIPYVSKNDFPFWCGTVMLNYADFISPQSTREYMYNETKRKNAIFLEKAGWHFSYIGNVNQIIEKLESFAHTEYNTSHFKNMDRIKNAINNGIDLFERNQKFEFIPINKLDILPEYLIKNIDLYKHIIKL